MAVEISDSPIPLTRNRPVGASVTPGDVGEVRGASKGGGLKPGRPGGPRQVSAGHSPHNTLLHRVPKAQGKRQKKFPVRENTGNLDI